MNVNEKGVKGLIKVIDDLQEKGFLIFPAFDDHSPIDLVVVDRQGKTYRLQVKYREKNPRKIKERYCIQASSVVNGKKIPIDKSMIDGWAVYLSDSKKVVYINKDLLEGKKELTIDPEKEYGDMAEWFKAASC